MLHTFPLCLKQDLLNTTLINTLFVKAYTCYRPTTVADILVNSVFSLLNVSILQG